MLPNLAMLPNLGGPLIFPNDFFVRVFGISISWIPDSGKQEIQFRENDYSLHQITKMMNSGKQEI